ncbi:MAG: hypothetical protein LBV70_01610, partial [Candidatus Adiutrix sp.]|nr:hypothetical protein [Candidatus Adiutrix sp.]
MADGKTPDENVITDEDLDTFLAIGSEELRGAELIPASREETDLSEFIRGSVLPSDHFGADIEDETERDIALARY